MCAGLSCLRSARAENAGQESKPDIKDTPDKESAKEPAEKSTEKPAKEPSKEPAEALPEVVVTASRLPTPSDKTGVSVSSIKAEVIEATQQNDADTQLQYVPGVTIARTGLEGSQSSLFIRGGDSNQTEILFDGWRVNRQGGAFDFAGLDTLGVDRIEVARGPASSVFGSDAMTGAVNLVTAKGEGSPTLTTSVAGGTYGTDRETISLSGQEKQFSYNIAASQLGRHDGPYKNSDLDLYNYVARLDFDINPDQALKLIVRGTDLSKGYYENTATGYGPGAEPPNPNSTLHNSDTLVGLEYKGQILPIWQTTLRLGHYEIDLDYDSKSPAPPSPWLSPPDNTVPLGTTNTHEHRYMLDWQNNILAYEAKDIRNTVTLGFYAEHESYEQEDTIYDANEDVSQTNCAGYFQDRLELYERVFLTGGVRQEHNEQFGSFTTARGDVSILIPESATRLHGSVGNAFRAPSFYELYAAGTGDAHLEPEQNMAWDAGVEQNFWQKRINLGATYFNNSFNNLIEYGYATQHFGNIATASSRGVEASFTLKPVKDIEFQSAATWLHTENNTGQPLLRRPRQTFTERLIMRPLVHLVPAKLAGLEVTLSALNVSDDSDIGPTKTNSFATMTNPEYTRFDAAASYRFLEHWRVFARMDNFTNAKYETAKTFPAEGASFLGGLEFTWKF
jgi:vitamin B12 transporter